MTLREGIYPRRDVVFTLPSDKAVPRMNCAIKRIQELLISIVGSSRRRLRRISVLIVGRVIGRSLRIVEISPDEARRELLRVGPLPAVNMLLEAWAAALSQPAHVTSTVAEITGAPAKTFLQWATDNATEFRA